MRKAHAARSRTPAASGFGPKLPKAPPKAAQEEKVDPQASYSIRLDREEEDVLRQVLKAAQEHSAPPMQRLMKLLPPARHHINSLVRCCDQ